MTVSAHVTLTVAYLPSYIQEVLDSNGNLEAIGLVISQVQLGKCTKTRYRLVIALGYTVKNFEIDEYICWGTPNDLKTYEYWQRFFNKVNWHPYEYEKDYFTN